MFPAWTFLTPTCGGWSWPESAGRCPGGRIARRRCRLSAQPESRVAAGGKKSYNRVSMPASRSAKTVKAIYPGSFDPITNGHLDLIERGSKIFDELVVGVLRNVEKDPLFSVEERVEMLELTTRHVENVRVEAFEGLLVDYVARHKAQAVLRGIRAISDYEYELQMALMNRRLAPGIETVFMMPADTYSYVSSRLVKQVFHLGGSVKGLVPPVVEERLHQKVRAARPQNKI